MAVGWLMPVLLVSLHAVRFTDLGRYGRGVAAGGELDRVCVSCGWEQKMTLPSRICVAREHVTACVFGSTQSRPNKAGLKCPSVRTTSVRSSTKSFFDFHEIWHVRTGQWVMHDGICSITRSKVKVTIPSKLEIRLFSKATSSAIYNGSWQLTTDS